MDTIQISIEATETEQEILISELDGLGANGFEQTTTHLLAYFTEDNFPSYEVNLLLQPYSHVLARIQEQNWNAVWEQNFEPVVVDSFCAIRAHFHQPIKDVTHEIIITPKMSFGTGHHATTYMMIGQMKDIDFTGKKVFDFGTGTGILAILAEKLGAASITAIDVDDWSIINTRENAEQNNCHHITVSQTSLLPEETFPIILANINRNVILQYLEQLKRMTQPVGLLLFSGLLKSDMDDIVEACTKLELHLIKHTERANWISLLFVNRK
ncbi:MAG TPA: 50S ribosomal protein L11 methyltransferase [Flavisolibacter sp.]|jgi:ribosomal protein L11 methyltransferase|nr:50S ribosomal protein L11 methyltransferase [Flavisolibacter sp.]